MLKKTNNNGWNVLMIAARYQPSAFAPILDAIVKTGDKALLSEMLKNTDNIGWNGLMIAACYQSAAVAPILDAIEKIGDKEFHWDMGKYGPIDKLTQPIWFYSSWQSVESSAMEMYSRYGTRSTELTLWVDTRSLKKGGVNIFGALFPPEKKWIKKVMAGDMLKEYTACMLVSMDNPWILIVVK